MKCPLCELREDETIHYEDDLCIVLETLHKKGHNNRIMVISKEHTKVLTSTTKHHCLMKLIEIGKALYTNHFIVCSDKYSRIPSHWHLIATDFDGWDFEQILETPFMVVNENDIDENTPEN